jgi:hypothetical protein
VSALGTVLERALALVVEPARPDTCATAGSARARAPSVAVVGLSRGCGASTVARGLAMIAPAMEVGEGTAVPHDAVVAAVADGRSEPVLAGLVAEILATRHERVVLVANRPADAAEWSRKGAVCVPASRLGVRLVMRGRRPTGAMGRALRDLARAVEVA